MLILILSIPMVMIWVLLQLEKYHLSRLRVLIFINKCGYNFDDIQDAIRVKRALNETGNICPNFEIIVIE